MSQNTLINSVGFGKDDKRRILAEESAIVAFTEEVLRRLHEIGMSKSDLAAKMKVEPAAVSKLISGNNNFTLKTMVKIAMALGSRIRFSMVPAKPKKVWVAPFTPHFRIAYKTDSTNRIGSSYKTLIHEEPEPVLLEA